MHSDGVSGLAEEVGLLIRDDQNKEKKFLPGLQEAVFILHSKDFLKNHIFS